MNSGSVMPKSNPVRQHKLFPYPPDLTVSYEGHGESVHLSGPNISTQGMFINTPNRIPEGAVLTVRFRLHRINYTVTARCEVRYCLPGVGVGVEFVALAPEAHDAIEREVSDDGS